MKIELHRLALGDTDDPTVMAGFVLSDWASTEKGIWCQQHCRDLTYYCSPNINTWGFDVIVTGDIDPGSALSEFHLRWS